MRTSPYYTDSRVTLYHGKALDIARQLPAGSVDCIVTSPPYFGLRDYGVDGQYGLEDTAAEYVENLRALFDELHRLLRDDGTLWLILGDTYSGRANASAGPTSGNSRPHVLPGRKNTTTHIGPKQKLGIPWRVAFALQENWILRNEIIWDKPNAKPESVTDRVSNRHEHIFMFSKSLHYWFDLDAIREPVITQRRAKTWAERKQRGEPTRHGRGGPGTTAISGFTPGPGGRNPGDVWRINTQRFRGAHFAVMPPKLAQKCVLAGCKPGGVVLDPCSGAGTSGQAAQRTGRRYIGIDINAEYLDLSLRTRLRDAALDFDTDATTHGEPA